MGERNPRISISPSQSPMRWIPWGSHSLLMRTFNGYLNERRNGGRNRTRTCEGFRRRIYSALELLLSHTPNRRCLCSFPSSYLLTPALHLSEPIGKVKPMNAYRSAEIARGTNEQSVLFPNQEEVTLFFTTFWQDV